MTVTVTRTVSPSLAPVTGVDGASSSVYERETANPRFKASTPLAGVA